MEVCVRNRFVLGQLACACVLSCSTTDLSGLPDLPAGQVLSADGRPIFVRQSGSGPDVVLLHGLGDSSLGWLYLEGPLVEAGYRVTVWDALGAGRSAKPSDGDYSLAAHLRRLVAALDILGVEKTTVVGHSLGGSLALAFARTHPQRTAALCLVDPAAYREGALGGRWFWETPLVAEIVLGVISTEMLVDFGLKQNFADTARIPDELRKLYIREARRDAVIDALIHQERQLVPEDAAAWEAGHRAIVAPTLILWGEGDALVPVAQGRRLAREIAGAELVILPRLAHSPQLEDPAAVLAHLVPFLAAQHAERIDAAAAAPGR
jgi:pimeloyl-ACP methyl ester carboxylesterase